MKGVYCGRTLSRRYVLGQMDVEGRVAVRNSCQRVSAILKSVVETVWTTISGNVGRNDMIGRYVNLVHKSEVITLSACHVGLLTSVKGAT